MTGILAHLREAALLVDNLQFLHFLHAAGRVGIVLSILVPELSLFSWPAMVAAFVPGLSAWCVYGFDRVCRVDPIADKINNPRLYNFHARYGHITNRFFPVVLAVACLLSLTDWRVVMLKVLGLLLSVAYVTPVVPLPSGWCRLKDITWLKNVSTAVVWAVYCALIPSAVAWRVQGETAGSGVTTSQVALLFFSCLFMECAHCLTGDIEDQPGDSKQGVTTLATVLGFNASICLSSAYVVASCFCLFHAASVAGKPIEGLVYALLKMSSVGTLMQRLTMFEKTKGTAWEMACWYPDVIFMVCIRAV